MDSKHRWSDRSVGEEVVVVVWSKFAHDRRYVAWGSVTEAPTLLPSPLSSQQSSVSVSPWVSHYQYSGCISPLPPLRSRLLPLRMYPDSASTRAYGVRMSPDRRWVDRVFGGELGVVTSVHRSWCLWLWRSGAGDHFLPPNMLSVKQNSVAVTPWIPFPLYSSYRFILLQLRSGLLTLRLVPDVASALRSLHLGELESQVNLIGRYRAVRAVRPGSFEQPLADRDRGFLSLTELSRSPPFLLFKLQIYTPFSPTNIQMVALNA